MTNLETSDQGRNDDIVLALAMSPAFATDRVCFAARGSGVYRSDDGGESWRSAYTSLGIDPSPATTAIAVSPRFESDHTLLAGVHGGVLRSFDGGKTWLAATLPSPPPLLSSLVVAPAFPGEGIVFASTLEDGIFRSEDRGSSWTPSNFGLLDLEVLSIAISPSFAVDQTVYAGTGTGLFRSTNGGRAWKEVEGTEGWGAILSLALSPGYRQDGIVFAGTEEHGLVRSDDHGQTWTAVIDAVIAGPVNQVLVASNGQTPRDILALLEREVLVSRDGGDSWSNLPLDGQPTTPMTTVATPGYVDGPGSVLVGFSTGEVARGAERSSDPSAG